jgi:recombinational DNA repair protein RecR
MSNSAQFSEKHVMPITAQEEKEVHRVFEMLCDYAEKTKLKSEVDDIKIWLNANRNKSHLEHAEENIQSALTRIEELNNQLHYLENKIDKKVSCNDIMEILKKLGSKINKKEVEEMIWEVDENLDGCLDWTEFRLMFNRNITDRTGLEPCRMVRKCFVLDYF